MKRTILFTVIASILAITAFADPKTITTQDYVDNTFQTKIPAQSGTQPTVITSTNTAGTVGEQGIWGYDYIFYGPMSSSMQAYKDNVITLDSVRTALRYITHPNYTTSVPNGTADTVKELPVFSPVSGSDTDKFYKVLTTNTLNYDGTWNTYDVIPTLMAVNAGMDTKQDKMTCARYIENAEQTAANCLLWNVPD